MDKKEMLLALTAMIVALFSISAIAEVPFTTIIMIARFPVLAIIGITIYWIADSLIERHKNKKEGEHGER